MFWTCFIMYCEFISTRFGCGIGNFSLMEQEVWFDWINASNLTLMGRWSTLMLKGCRQRSGIRSRDQATVVGNLSKWPSIEGLVGLIHYTCTVHSMHVKYTRSCVEYCNVHVLINERTLDVPAPPALVSALTLALSSGCRLVLYIIEAQE